MKLNENQFLTTKQVEQLIKTAKKTDWPTFNSDKDNIKDYAEKVKKIYYSIFGTIPSSFRLLNCLDFKTPLFRVRELDKIKNINLFTEHSYPPAAYTNFGRCNFPKYPVFYSSNKAMVSLMEVIRQDACKNKSFCVSKWEVNRDESTKIKLQHYLNQPLPKENPFKELREKDHTEVTKIFQKSLSKDQINGFNKLMEFFSSQFTSNKNYHISASLTYDIFFDNPKRATDILIYPSIQSKYKGVNFALHPNFVDNMLKLKRLYWIKINEFNPESNSANFTFGEYADIENNKPIWKKLPEDENKRLEFLNEDFEGVGRS